MKAFASFLAAAGSAAAVTIAEINGNRFLSPLDGKSVTDVTGVVTAVSKNGIYLRSAEPDDDPVTSEGLFVYGSSAAQKVEVGDLVSLDGVVKEYRAKTEHIYLTQLTDPTNIVVVSSSHKVKPLVIGKDTLPPPTRDFSKLDKGGIFGVPNAVDTVSAANPKLDPATYGLDFWESLVGELVILKDVYQTSRPSKYGDVWVRGSWAVTGINSHGGVTMLDGDANPETVIIGTPLDGSSNPIDTKMGDYLGDVTGVVSNAFGFYRVLPLTSVSPLRNASATYSAVSFSGDGTCKAITVADYNAENLAPDSAHMPRVVDQIVHKLLLPDLIFLQEIQDGSGPTDDGVVSANVTLATLTQGIEEVSSVVYQWAEVDPVDGEDGGQPGGNIRCAYLYRPDVVELYKPNQGGSLDANKVLDGPKLKYNPGRIDPANKAFDDSRKPIAAAWKPVKGSRKPFFTVNVHFSSKGGSTTLHGDARPPVNKGVERRTQQTTITANFIRQILAKDPKARIIAAGDFNEFTQVQPMQVFAAKSGLRDIDELVGLDPVERYTYLYDMNSQALDHLYVSPALAAGSKVEHMHLNTWQNFAGQTSDHDPSVALLNLCGGT
ncbi:endonuclease/exonuclease/phosphatase family protein [Drechmeria coniospora]|uniref:Endonuclease/exonuclease/phosphatase family protein n=1 Tax=Drechmeria coniospora TaxID=98403 RepID=A0A151GD52_DRECN|nr:endonuclease/exonuclease/phosphatase family protein [Drechmeria coniospora]KYK55020.1 endonuclease/exonuclease/phosphatase family protein [Drechmeria coniospora]ODA82351.1 hypothetical protein RJ55_00858 [Drechmeria coniospora]